MAKLCINLDHIATIRQARRGTEPDPVSAVTLVELAGADGITLHLREDRRHIQDRDLRLIKQIVKTKLNMEMAATDEMTSIALDVRPDQITLVPEKREEITTEGGLLINKDIDRLRSIVSRFKKEDIAVSFFVDPDATQIEAAKETGVEFIEINTGRYAEAHKGDEVAREYDKIRESVNLLHKLGLRVYAGHGLNYRNITLLKNLPHIEEYNIGHSIISRAVFTGLFDAVAAMKRLVS